jgi:dihydroorotase
MADFDLVVRNGTVVRSGGRDEQDIGVRDGAIVALEPGGALAGTGTVEIDATGQYVLPGLIDAHVHFREPGAEHEETWLTGSRAAVMGGVTTVLEMPNTVPPTDRAARAREKVAIARAASYCDFGLFGLVGESIESVSDLVQAEVVIGLKVFMGPTTGDLRVPDDDCLREALAMARDAGLRVAFHAEDRATIESSELVLRSAGRTDAVAHLEARSDQAEVIAIEHAGRLLGETGARGHILHLSSAAGLGAVERLRDAGVDVTCEVTPHHLFLDRDVYSAVGAVARVNPPIRGGADAAALRAALADGRIDLFATDHAPHTAVDKRRESIWDVPSGFAGVETMLRLLLTRGVHEGWLSLERLVEATSEAPARTWSLRPEKGAIEIGSSADITIVDLDREGVIRADELHGKSNVSPFEGYATRGMAVATIVRGNVQMRDGQLTGQPPMLNSITRQDATASEH